MTPPTCTAILIGFCQNSFALLLHHVLGVSFPVCQPYRRVVLHTNATKEETQQHDELAPKRARGAKRMRGGRLGDEVTSQTQAYRSSLPTECILLFINDISLYFVIKRTLRLLQSDSLTV
jgi:hypothetical protein